MDSDKENVKQLVSRLREIQSRSGMEIPNWMLDENRYGKGDLTTDEQHEWAETICQSMRSTVALTYLIESEKRWGTRDGEYQFKTGEFSFGLTRELIENILIEYVETILIKRNPQQRYVTVFQFYYANDHRQKEDGYSWFSDFLDDMFVDLAARLRAGEGFQAKPAVH